MSTNRPYPVAVVIGRWQLPHLAHKALIDHAFGIADRVLIVLGSAWRSRDPRNPFREFERQAMLESMMTAGQRERAGFLDVRDYYDNARWAGAVRAGVAGLHPQGPVALVGHGKDAATGGYLGLFPQWDYVDGGSPGPLDATSLRAVFFARSPLETNLSALASGVHPAVIDWLRAWAALPLYRERQDEHHAMDAYRQKYPGPYHLTADAVCEVDGHVLLVRRASLIGRGLWALPGGFMDPGETFYETAIRELNEETGLSGDPESMRVSVAGSAVFDHPGRSPRGRLITQAFHIRLNRASLPEVRGADDAAEARWWPIADLPTIEAELFEDHACILDHFVGMAR